ncbi:hypothetical protein LOTGIDRAFT_237540 [Lottia gigantea]|uniref:ATPase MORC2 chromo domain-containing protein n=1 Tax=Lottia gigantea TaxID=225164 RepID=V4B9M0_LOTGI|nr:hypothetical protein LOTGIDRAFT_237540 [Lottia gigantea]ESP04126.1 hypothetical protein LOTGIDRAFT_237540 [Lottia gigantea]
MLEKLKKQKVINSSRELKDLEKDHERERELQIERKRIEREKTLAREQKERERLKAEREKQKVEDERKKERDRERALRDRERAAERAEREKEKAFEKKEKDKEKLEIQKQRERERIEREKERERERAKAAKARTVAQAKLKSSPVKSKPPPKSNMKAIKSGPNQGVQVISSAKLKETSQKPEIRKPAYIESTRRASSVSSASESDADTPLKRGRKTEDSEIDVPAKKIKSSSTDSDSDFVKDRLENNEADATSDSKEENMEVDKNGVTLNDADSNDEVGTRVGALVNGKWYMGCVVKVAADGKWKVKFDNHPKDKYDKWFDKKSKEIRIAKNGQKLIESSNEPPPSPVGEEEKAEATTDTEAPTSSTATPSSSQNSQINEEIANGYRTCLRYFLPPQWIMDKDAISAMADQELSVFPLDDFFDHYERGLRRLVSNFQTEAAARKQEADESKNKLSSLRKLIAKLLKSINEEFDIDPEADGEQVDELLAVCVRQATQSNPS